jgi:PadR family transcriptional regulator, regulatory protein PadR
MRTHGETQQASLLPGTLCMLMLQALARVGPLHGYAIAQHIRRTTDDVLQVEEGALYPALQRMLLKGWVTAEWQQTEHNRRARVYSLTDAGRAQLRQEAAEFDRVVAAIALLMRPAAGEV